jgi:hypothetical protein
VDFFRKSGAVDEPTIQSETDRYIAWPAQALSYKLGQLKIRELRERARKELGVKFDIRSFHDEMLDGGTLPLDLLEARTDKWIAQQKIKVTASLRERRQAGEPADSRRRASGRRSGNRSMRSGRVILAIGQLKMDGCASRPRLNSVVNTAFTVNSEEPKRYDIDTPVKEKTCLGNGRQLPNHTMSTIDKIQAPQYRHPHWLS